MPRLPDSLGALPTPTPAGPASGITLPKENPAIEAGHALSRAGSELHQVFIEEQKRIDTAKVEDAYNQLRNSQLDLTIGEKDGFQAIKGGDAIKRPLLKDYTQRFTDTSKTLADALDNDDQRAMFKKRSEVSQTQFTQDLLQHLYKENDVYQKQVTTATLDTEFRSASAKWNAPAEVMASLVRIDAAIDREADRQGLPPEMRADLKMKEAAKVHSAVIGQALAEKKFDYAKSWFDTHQDQIDAPTAKLLSKEVENASQKQVFNT